MREDVDRSLLIAPDGRTDRKGPARVKTHRGAEGVSRDAVGCHNGRISLGPCAARLAEHVDLPFTGAVSLLLGTHHGNGARNGEGAAEVIMHFCVIRGQDAALAPFRPACRPRKNIDSSAVDDAVGIAPESPNKHLGITAWRNGNPEEIGHASVSRCEGGAGHPFTCIAHEGCGKVNFGIATQAVLEDTLT